MGFDAGKAVAALDWTFSPYLEDARGTIPEPTQAEFEAFMDALGEIAQLEDGEEPDEIASAVKTALADDGLVKQFWPKVMDALEPICKGAPSREQLEALPARLRFAFFDWLTNELTDPTKPSAATRR